MAGRSSEAFPIEHTRWMVSEETGVNGVWEMVSHNLHVDAETLPSPFQNMKEEFTQCPTPPRLVGEPDDGAGMTGDDRELMRRPFYEIDRLGWIFIGDHWYKVYNLDRDGDVRLGAFRNNRVGEVFPRPVTDRCLARGFHPPLVPLVVEDDPVIGTLPRQPPVMSLSIRRVFHSIMIVSSGPVGPRWCGDVCRRQFMTSLWRFTSVPVPEPIGEMRWAFR